MKSRATLALFLLLSSYAAVAADAIPMSPETYIGSSTFEIDRVDYAFEGKRGLVLWMVGGQRYAVRTDADGTPLDRDPIVLPATNVGGSRVTFDEAGFIVVAQSAEGLEAIRIADDGTIGNPTAFATGATGFAIARSRGEALAIASFSNRLFGENLEIFRLVPGGPVSVFRSRGLGSIVSIHSAAFDGSQGFVNWGEEALVWERGAFGWYQTIVPVWPSGSVNLDSGEVVRLDHWIGPPLLTGYDHIWLAAPNGLYALRPDGTSERRIAIDGPPGFTFGTAARLGKSVLTAPLGDVTRVRSSPGIPRIPLTITARWLDATTNPIVPSPEFTIASQSWVWVLRETDDERIAIVYTKIAAGQPDRVFIRFLGEREPSRTRPVQR